jgi:hypothetical protein
MQARTGISERRACQLIGLSRSVLRYQARPSEQNTKLQTQLVKLAQERRRVGDRRPAHPAAACGPAAQPQTDLSPVPSRLLDGEAAGAPARCSSEARTLEPTERSESGVVNGLCLRCTQYRMEDQMQSWGQSRGRIFAGGSLTERLALKAAMARFSWFGPVVSCICMLHHRSRFLPSFVA